jgi:lysophospholipase L1-like esterase
MKVYKILLVVLTIVCAQTVLAQNPPFYDEIQAFKKQDSAHFPGKGKILFVGSSSFQHWHDVQSYFPNHPIINRGFGGSSLPDVIRYVNDIIFPYSPKQIVIYCGENDLAASDTVSAMNVFVRFRSLFHLIRKHMPNVPIVFISLKPSPSREHLMPKMAQANRMIKNFLKTQKNASFVDVYSKMLDANGKPRKELFGEDMLHMNKKGYELWKSILEPYLIPLSP